MMYLLYTMPCPTILQCSTLRLTPLPFPPHIRLKGHHQPPLPLPILPPPHIPLKGHDQAPPPLPLLPLPYMHHIHLKGHHSGH